MFIRDLWQQTQAIFRQALPGMPCASLFRPRAEAAAQGVLAGMVMKTFSDCLKTPHSTEKANDAA